MSENLYAPPTAAVAELARSKLRTEFYVVGGFKMALLSVATLGLYHVYWFYMHWARYRTWHRSSMLPAARALFALLFVHSLANRIDARLRAGASPPRWRPLATATGYVVLILLGYVAAFVPSGIWWMDAGGNLLLVPQTWLLWKLQRAANFACGQPEAETNRRLTWANWIWLVFGGLLWLALLATIATPVDVTLPQR